MIKQIESTSLKDFLENEKNLQKDNGIENVVREIIQRVKNSGNKAFISFINKYEEKDFQFNWADEWYFYGWDRFICDKIRWL